MERVGDINFGEALRMTGKIKEGSTDRGSSVQPSKPENFKRPEPAHVPAKPQNGKEK